MSVAESDDLCYGTSNVSAWRRRQRLLHPAGTIVGLLIVGLALAACATSIPKSAERIRPPTDRERAEITQALLPLLWAGAIWPDGINMCAAALGVLPIGVVNLAAGPHPRCKFALVVTEGALQQFDRIELTAALAHELGHVELGHFAARRARREAERKSQQRIDAAGEVGGVAGAIPVVGPLVAVGTGAMQTVAEVAVKTAYRGYDRDEELAADRFALQVLDGIGPGRCRTLVALLSRMRRQSEQRIPFPWLHDHPTFAVRYDAASLACPTAADDSERTLRR